MRLHRVGFAALVVSGAALAFACRAFDSSAEGPASPDASSDSSPNETSMLDAATDVVVADAGSGCVNLIKNPSFEDQPKCVPWINYGGDAGDSTPARTGANACFACSAASINLNAVVLGRTFAAGESVHVELWVRAADSTLVAVRAGLYVETTTTNSGDGANVNLSTEYQRLAFDFAMPLDGGAAQVPQISVIVQRSDEAGVGCMLMDDVTVCQGDGDGG